MGADYGLLNNNLPEFKPVNKVNALMTGMQQVQDMRAKNQDMALKQQEAASKDQYYANLTAKAKQEMNFEQLKLTNEVMGAVKDPASYQRGLMTLKKAGIDTSDMPNTYDENAKGVVNTAYQVSGRAMEDLKTDLIRSQIGNQNAQAAKAALPPQLNTSNTVPVIDPVTKQPRLVPIQEAVTQGLPIVPTNKGTTVNVGGNNINVPTGFMVDPQAAARGETRVIPIPGGPDDKLTVEAAAKIAAIKATDDDLINVKNLFFKDGKYNPQAVMMAQNVMGFDGVPFSQGREGRQALNRVITAKLRAESGAAIPDTEIERYMSMFMPNAFDNEKSARAKLIALERWRKYALLSTTKGLSVAEMQDEMYKKTQEFLSDAKNFSEETATPGSPQQSAGLQPTPDVIAQYRQQYPGKSDEQIKAAIELYNKQNQQPTAEKKSLNNGESMLGDTVKKYESGNTGAATISTGKGDPGGVSYGTYQLSSNAGTLDRFLKYTGYSEKFKGLKPGSAAFNDRWRELATNDSQFANAQHAFIADTHYKPVANVAQQLGLPMTPRVAEAIWSMSVQHGKADMLVKRAAALTQDPSDENELLKNLYKVRRQYVMGLNNLPYQTKKSILARYDNEEKDVFNMAV